MICEIISNPTDLNSIGFQPKGPVFSLSLSLYLLCDCFFHYLLTNLIFDILLTGMKL